MSLGYFRRPDEMPEILSSANMAFSPWVLLGIPNMATSWIILSTFFGMSGDGLFNAVCLIYFVTAAPVTFIAGLWYSYVYLPRKWYDDYHSRNIS